MLLKTLIRLAILVAVAAAAACTQSRNPVAPAASQPAAPLQTLEVRITGAVLDSVFRPLAGAEVELSDQAGAWGVVTTDEKGRFEFNGAYTLALTLRATKSGYEPSTTSLNLASYRCCEGRVTTNLTLAPVNSVHLQPGPYTLTFDASDRSCSFIPEELRAQHFDATLTIPAWGSSLYQFEVTDRRFDSFLRFFYVGVAGRESSVAEDGWLYWQPAPLRRFEVSVDPGPISLSADAFTFRMGATTSYCEFNTSVLTNCSRAHDDQVVTRGFCATPLTLSPR